MIANSAIGFTQLGELWDSEGNSNYAIRELGTIDILAKFTDSTTIEISTPDTIPSGFSVRLYRASKLTGTYSSIGIQTLPYSDTVTENVDYKYKAKLERTDFTDAIKGAPRPIKATNNVL